jgi:hypothetical protein
MDLHQGEVPGAEVWAVVMITEYSYRDVQWFITPSAATEDYREVVEFITKARKGMQGQAERWHITLPAQRMEAEAVTIWVEGLLNSDSAANPDYARRLDVFKQKEGVS